jgi:hypothetical protein
MLAVENVSIVPAPVVVDELVLDEPAPLPEWAVLPLMVVEEDTRPFPAVTEDELDAALPESMLSTTVQVVPSANFKVSAAKTGSATKIAGMQAVANNLFGRYFAEIIVSLRISLLKMVNESGLWAALTGAHLALPAVFLSQSRGAVLLALRVFGAFGLSAAGG